MLTKRLFRQMIKIFKRQYGVPITFIRQIGSENDRETGARTPEYSSKKIAKALVLPYEVQRTFIYDLSYIANNKDFTRGGFFDKTKITVIVEGKDLPSQHDLSDMILIEDVVWEISGKSQYPQGLVWLFQVEQIKGMDSERIIAEIS